MSVIVFLGPSLPLKEAKKLLRADYRPPARQGDVFRALEASPSAIVLIDGVFEAEPSVWHHELIAAYASGVALFGACSMGALRAAELPGVVTPLGRIAERFVRGEWNDDAAVALLHGDAAQNYRPLSVPWVNVWATAQAAKPVLGARDAQRLCDVAESIFYQSRTWPRIFEALKWNDAQRARVQPVDLKADDARFALSHVATARPRRHAPRPSNFSSFVRRSRLGARGLEGAEWKEGVKTLLLAEFARLSGISPEAEAVAKHRKALKGRFSADQLETWAHALALEALILEAPELFVSDGPSSLEGAALLHARRRSL